MGLAITYGIGQYSAGHATEAHTAGWDRAYKASIGGRGLVWGHSSGTGSSQEPWLPANSTLPLLKGLASVLGPIMSADLGGITWGNTASQGFVTDAWAWVKAQYGAKTDKLILAGVSGGALAALNWARANPTLVKAVVLFYPCVALQAQYEATGGAIDSHVSISAAYGGVPTYATFDPSNGTHPASYTGVPIYMGYSDSDTVVGTANQIAFISAVGGSTLASRVYAGAAHADMTKINVNDLVTWINSYT